MHVLGDAMGDAKKMTIYHENWSIQNLQYADVQFLVVRAIYFIQDLKFMDLMCVCRKHVMEIAFVICLSIALPPRQWLCQLFYYGGSGSQLKNYGVAASVPVSRAAFEISGFKKLADLFCSFVGNQAQASAADD